MKPIGPMMREHRLIERMLTLLQRELETIQTRSETDTLLIETAVDFFRTYADRTHHGKEEEIYFRDLAEKDIAPEHRRIMNELIAEHAYARGEVRALSEANDRHASGERAALDEIARHLTTLVGFYPDHIKKEDRHFFFPTQEYFSKEEQEAMLDEFRDFDASMVHEKYSTVVERMQKSLA